MDAHAREIRLSDGAATLVHVDDYEWLSRFKWHRHHRANYGYVMRRPIEGGRRRLYLMHRVILRASQGEVVDHINGNVLDNRRSNLRICTTQQNTCNRLGLPGTSSRFKNVTWDKQTGRWKVKVKVNGRAHNLGRFDSEEHAARVADEFARQAHGEFARLNFPQGS